MNYNRKQRGIIKDQVVFPVSESLSEMPKDYLLFVNSLKSILYIPLMS